MGITISGDFDGLADKFMSMARDQAEEAAAEAVAEKARSAGLGSADTIKIDLTVDGDDDGKLGLDAERIRARANEILAGG